MKMNSGAVVLWSSLLITLSTVRGRLEPTKLVNNGLFKLRNQHDGKFLADDNGYPTKAEENESNNQRFEFINSEGSEVWMLVNLSSGQALSSTSWKIRYVGHGKYQFKNIKSGLCLQGTGVTEAVCGTDNPLQRWFVEPSAN